MSPIGPIGDIGRGIVERDVMKCEPYSALMPAVRITLPHFSVSSAQNLAKSAGGSASTPPPRSASRALMFGLARPPLISLLSLYTLSIVVAFDEPTQYQVLASYPGTDSLMVGTSSIASERVAALTPSARSLPVLMCPTAEGMEIKLTCTCPAMRSLSAGPPPR